MATHGPMSRRTVPRARVHACTRLRRPCRGGRLRRRAARRAVAAQHGHRPGRRSARGRCVRAGSKKYTTSSRAPSWLRPPRSPRSSCERRRAA